MSRATMFAALLAVCLAAPVMAQDTKAKDSKAQDSNRSSGDQNRGGDRGGDRGRFTDMIKERMGVTDDEWKVIEPKFTKVSDIRREQMGSMFGGFRRGGDNNGDSQNRSAMQTASRELRDTLENKDATAEQIQAKLKSFREARDETKKKLTSAQAELKEVLTQRQEAVLVSMGMLD